MHIRNCFLLLTFCCVFASCSNNDNPNRGKPIVLGEPSTIVTEQDPKYLEDFVAEVKPSAAPETEPAKDTATTAPAAALTEPAKESAPAPVNDEPKESGKTGEGLTIDLDGVSLFIPDITTKEYKHRNNKKANGATYQLASGELNGNQIKITSGNVTKVSQRYQTEVAVKNNLGTLALPALSTTTDWQPVTGKGNVYKITGLDATKTTVKATPAAIRNAVSKATGGRRMRRVKAQWENSVQHVRSLNQKPMMAAVRSVMWKIEGKDAKGKNYQRQVRVDIPL